jgi:hypothetical protein
VWLSVCRVKDEARRLYRQHPGFGLEAQGIEPYGTPPLIVRRVRAASLAVTAPRLGLPAPGKYEEDSNNGMNQATEGEAG